MDENRSVKRVYIIKDDIDLLYQLLDEMKNGFNYLYINCLCNIKIDNEIIKTNKLNMALHNSDNNTLIVFPQDGNISRASLEKMLADRDINYAQIVFNKQPERIDDNNLPEVYYCHNEDNLANRLDNAINKGKIECQYHTGLTSILKLGYKTRKGKMATMFRIETKSLIKMGNDMMLLISEQYDKDSTKISRELGIRTELKKRGLGIQVMPESTTSKSKKRERIPNYNRKPKSFI